MDCNLLKHSVIVMFFCIFLFTHIFLALIISNAGTGIKRNRKKMKASRELNDYYQAHKTEMTKGKKE